MMIDNLIEAVKDENWELVDEEIPKICNNGEFFRWASDPGLEDSDGNIRDFAASILEKTKRILSPDVKARLYTHMKTDENPYVRFRSAFALINHKPIEQYLADVLKVLREASEDPEVADIAKDYLSRN